MACVAEKEVPAGTEAEKKSDKKRKAPTDGKADVKRQKADFSVGDRGVFFTCAGPGQVNKARTDLFRLLEEVVTSRESCKKVEGGTSAAIDAELAALKEKRERFTSQSEKSPKGTGFVRFQNAEDVPSVMVEQLLSRQKRDFEEKGPRNQALCRVLPIDHTCKPFLGAFKEMAEKVVGPLVSAEAEPTVWALEFRSRNNDSLKKDAVLAIIDELVAKDRHKVNINNPTICILVEVNPLFCGLSIVSRWGELRKYNLHALTAPPETPGPKAAPASAAPRAEAPSPPAAQESASSATAGGAAAALPLPVVATEAPSEVPVEKSAVDAPAGKASSAEPLPAATVEATAEEVAALP